jgi:hypothetical protein
VTADQGGMFWDVHGAVIERVQGAGIDETYIYVTVYASKNRSAKNLFPRTMTFRSDGSPIAAVLRDGNRLLRCEDLGIPQSWRVGQVQP